MAFSRTGVQNAYNHHVKIGNWSEDQHLHEAKMKEYLYKKSRGELMIQQVDTHVQEALTEVGLSFSRDGYVHIGDHVMLFSLETEGVVSCDPADKVQAGERGFACTTSTVTKTHVARNTFVIEAVEKDQDRVRVGDVLRYGQSFRLRCNPRLCKGEAFYLHSQPISSISSSKVTRKQEVCMSANGTTYDSVWKVMGQDIRTRFDKDSLPVEANTEVVILHAVTHQALSSAKLRYPNDFGIEFELSAHTYLDINKNRGLNAELLGKTTSDIPKRREGSSNTFAILTASAQDSERKLGRTPEEDQLLHESISRVMERVRDDVRRLGADRLYEMVRAFQANDTQRADVLSYATFRSVLVQFGVATAFRPEEWEVLCSGLDPAKDGCVEYPMFLSIVRGELGPLRTRIIQQIFDKLDRRGNDVIALDELRKFATSTALPKVLARWAGLSVVTKHTFFEWYACVSAFIQSDEYFHKLITEEWHVRV